MPERFLDILHRYWQYDSFRPLQLETIEDVYAGKDTLVLMPTGGGKSIIYQVPGLALEGICVVITPLISLMKDQVDKLKKKCILAEAIHSGRSFRDIDRILDNCIYGDVKFLYVSPERIDSEIFRLRFSKMKVSLIAVDEAHCISQWGYDFRPSYLHIAWLRELKPDVPMLALTASATKEVAEDIMRHLKFKAPNIKRMSFARANLSYVIRRTEDKRENLLRIIKNVPGCGIVYVRTREKCEILSRFLNENGVSAEFYHGGLDYFDRNRKQEAWIKNQARIMVATNAFGMGIDKPDVRFVVHYDICDSIEAYYQEAGRAGRDGKKAYAVMLVSEEDLAKAQRRVDFNFPSIDTIKRIYEALFVYLQIAIGDGKGSSRAFNLYEFAARQKIFTLTALNAIKILQQNGYMVLTDEINNRTRIKFIVQRDDLYRIRINREDLDHFITVLLRLYSGLFNDFVPVEESEIAYASGYTTQHVAELFKTLWQLHIIKYIPGSKTPLLIFNEERLPVEDVMISPESYAIRKQVAHKRIKSMLDYVSNETECRSVVIQRYFGEEDAVPCGVCDICLNKKKSEKNAIQLLEMHILEKLEKTPMEIRELVASVKFDAREVVECITVMLRECKLVEDKTGKLRINR